MSTAEYQFSDLVRDGILQIGDGYRAKNNELGGDGLIFLRAAYLQDAGFILDMPDRFIASSTREFGNKISQLGDVVVTTKGNSTGRIGRIREAEAGAVYSPHLSYWRSLSKEILNQNFLYYWSQSNEFLSQLRGMAHGTDMAPYLSLRDQLRLRISLPDVWEQSAIGEVLATIDNKIELNRQMNATLDAMARAIFKDWFVDFGPTRAKMAGAKPYLAQEIWNLFPDRLDDESKPAGWPSIPMENVTRRITKGTTPTASEMKLTPALDNIVNFIRVNSLNDRGQIILEKLEHIPETVHLGALKRSILQEDDILYSIAGTIGRVAMVSKEILPANTNQALAIIRPETTKVPSRFLLMVLREEFFVDALHANIVQAVQANLSLSMISSAKLVVPPAHDLFTLFSPAESLIRRIEANNQESEVLSATRDALLPKLMSGEIRVNEAEKIAEHTLARAS